MLKRTKAVKKIIKYLAVLLGNFLFAASVVYFVLPKDIMTGGLAGIGLVLNVYFGFDVVLVIDILSIGLFLLGWFFLGTEFAITTAVSSIVYPIFVNVLSMFPIDLEINVLLAVLFGGALGGIGLGLVIKVDSSTGGTDIISLIINKYTKIDISILMVLVDFVIIGSALFIYPIENILYGLIYIYVYGVTMNKVIVGNTNKAVSITIITTHKDEICDFIHKELNRSATILKAMGAYSKKEVDCLLCVVDNTQLDNVENFVETVDPEAFMIIQNAKAVKGEGFTYLPK